MSAPKDWSTSLLLSKANIWKTLGAIQRTIFAAAEARFGSQADLKPGMIDARFALDSVAKVFSGQATKFPEAADAFRARRHEGLHRFIKT
jgi:hypothetical protein